MASKQFQALGSAQTLLRVSSRLPLCRQNTAAAAAAVRCIATYPTTTTTTAASPGARLQRSSSHVAAGNIRPQLPPPRRPNRILSGGVRWTSESATGSKIWSFEEIQSLPPNVTLIDVREPGEIASTGRIPGAVNIPITTSPDSFHISDEEFEDRFGFARPAPAPSEEDASAQEIVFYCKAGVRSRAAATIAREAGWKRVGEYPGSWVEWSAKGGKIER